jgi:hypothetical protein
MAAQRRNPYIEIEQGDTVPDLGPRPGKTGTDSARTFGAEPAFPALLERGRAIPVVTAVLGDASGASSFTAGPAPDGVVSPADTRRVLTAHLRAVLGSTPVSRPGKVLRSWPAGF